MPNEVMTQEEYMAHIESTVKSCLDLLYKRNEMYNSSEHEVDRMRNFRSTAYLLHTDPISAAAGMWTKHIAHLCDLVSDGQDHEIQVWMEPIQDCINYLLIMSALVKAGERTLNPPVNMNAKAAVDGGRYA